ncbi:hypothetical protein [Amycolatopsis sp.]|jgi:hypothetical protein|uniref:hypothetical protein n=1 Tax=Amycolatopsis sp. TaxID=37632 RepID=UPI002DFCC8D3|nr:hypothetical protein [Amycolatopsis sp.]
MKLKALLVALPITALTMLGAQVPGHAAAEQSASVVVASNKPSVTVHLDNGANGIRVANAISNIDEKDRGKFVQRVVDTAFTVSGRRFNVIVMNLSQGYNERLQGKRMYANIRYKSISYGLWITEAGQFTNTGDGGWINWGFRGWFNRNGMTVTFRHP